MTEPINAGALAREIAALRREVAELRRLLAGKLDREALPDAIKDLETRGFGGVRRGPAPRHADAGEAGR